MIPKNKRWENKAYTRWVATHECAACGIHDETIVPHHLKHIYSHQNQSSQKILED